MHTTVPETVRRHKSNDGTVSGRTVTRYDATLLETELDSAVEQSQPNILERDSTNVRAVHGILLLISGAEQIIPSQISALKLHVT